MKFGLALCAAVVLAVSGAARADLTESLKAGTMDIKQAGPMTFGPDGVLFIGDTQQGAVYAVATEDIKGDASKMKADVKEINTKIAGMLGTTAAEVAINDMVANPASGNVYMSVSRGRGATAVPVVVRLDSTGKLTELKLSDAKFAKSTFSNIAATGNQRTQSITDIKYANGKVIVAGLSNEEFASKLRAIDFPFKGADKGTSVEIFHGNHNALETRSPVRTFLVLDVKGQSNVLAAYTCTPLVLFPVDDLKGEKVRGKTIAELGMGNNPLDIISYKKEGKEFLLLNNSKFGVMKLATEAISTIAPITERVGGTAGLKFETIASLTGVTQLDKLNAENAVVLVTAGGNTEVRTVPLP